MSDEWANEAPTSLPPLAPGWRRKIQILSHTDAFKNNLAWAKAAVSYAKSKLLFGTSNKLGDVAGSYGGSLMCVAAMRVRQSFDGTNKPPIGEKEELEAVRKVAASGKAHGCGNCGELSAVAFMYLYDSGVRPLDWMVTLNADHQFVLIGRAAKTPKDVLDTKTWGPRCVISDPWKDFVGAGRHVDQAKCASPIEVREGLQLLYGTACRVE